MAFIITETDKAAYTACAICEKGVLLGFGSEQPRLAAPTSWHLGSSHTGNARWYATATPTPGNSIHLATVREEFDFSKSSAAFTVASETKLTLAPDAVAQSCVFGADGTLTEFQPITGWHAVSAAGDWDPGQGADSRFLMFTAPPGAITKLVASSSGTELLKNLCGTVAEAPSRTPAVYDRITNGQIWGASPAGHTTTAVGGSEAYSDRFLVRVQEVALHSSTGHVSQVFCSAFLFSDAEMRILLECPSRFRGGYFVTDTTEGVEGKTIAYHANSRSIAIARHLENSHACPISTAGQPDTGPLLLCAMGHNSRPTPFAFVPHVIPHTPTVPELDGVDESRLVTGVGMPFVLRSTGQCLGPTAGQPHATHARHVVMAATKALSNIVKFANHTDKNRRNSLPYSVYAASKASLRSHAGLAAATGHLVTALPALVEWAIGEKLHEAAAITVLQALRDGERPFADRLATHTRKLRFAMSAISQVVRPPPTVDPHPDSKRTITRVATMAPLQSCEVRGIVVLASPLDKHRGTQNKSVLLLDKGTHVRPDWNLHFVDPLDIGETQPSNVANASLTQQLVNAGHIDAVVGVWALDFCQTSVKLSDPWNCRNVSDSSSYTYFSAVLSSGRVAVCRVACNNRCHPGLPQGRVVRVEGEDQPNPDWAGIELLYTTSPL